MVSPPGRQPAKKKRRSAASFSGGGQSLGNGSAASSSAGGGRASSGAPTAGGGFRNQGNDPNQNPTFPTGSASAAPAASPRDDAAARAERLAAFERRAAAGAQRERLNEFECAICLEAFKGSACPGGRDRVAVLPCGHAMFCAPCAAKFRRCPQGCDGFRGILKLFL